MGIRRDGRATRSRGRQRLSASVQGAAGDGADTASQVTDSPCRFNAISYWDRQAFLAIGYVVLDTSTMPIVGEGDAEPNDTDVPQLIADAQAAVMRWCGVASPTARASPSAGIPMAPS